MKPIRGERDVEVAHEPQTWGSKQAQFKQADAVHTVSDAGAIESHRTARHFAAGCGCIAPPAGFCAVCSETACSSCFGFCERCRKPLCPRHTVFIEEPDDRKIRRCRPCHETKGRTRRLRQIGRLLLSPFIVFEKSHNEG